MGKHLAPSGSKHAKKKSGFKLTLPEFNKPDKINFKLPDLEKLKDKLHFSDVPADDMPVRVTADKEKLTVISAAFVFYFVLHFIPMLGWLRVLLYLMSYLAALYCILPALLGKIRKKHYINCEILVAAASALAFCIGESSAGALALILYAASEMYIGKFASDAEKIASAPSIIRPKSVNIVKGNGVEATEIGLAEAGDVFQVYPGELIPMDGVVTEGISAVDGSFLTGVESSYSVAPGSCVISGGINVSNALRIRADAAYRDSVLEKVLEAKEKAYSLKSGQEHLIDSITRVFTPIMAVLGLLLCVIPPLAGGEWIPSLRRGIIFLLLSCPAALQISAGLSYMGCISTGFVGGAVFKGSRFVENLANTGIAVFDKTGTVTEGKFEIVGIYPENISEQELLDIAATAENASDHPIARLLKDAGHVMDGDDFRMLQMEEIPGRGISAFIGGRQVYVGNSAMLEDHGIVCRTPEKPGSAIHVAIEGQYLGHILVTDKVRRSAFDALEDIRSQGVDKLVMLTGDVRSSARKIASSLNFDMVKSELTPDEKISSIQYLKNNKLSGTNLVFIGDGVRDASVMVSADTGIAMNAAFSASAVDACDIAMMQDDIRVLPYAMRLAKRAKTVVKQNMIGFAAGKAMLMILGLFNVGGIIFAAVADFVLSILTVVNSGRNFD